MEPGLRDRENTEGCIVTGGLSFCRNGARPERPGKREWHNRRNGKSEPAKAMPPWSPASETGKTRQLYCHRGSGQSRRNGARPERPGKPGSPTGTSSPTRRRNGARPERPGKLLAKIAALEAKPEPQWSPA